MTTIREVFMEFPEPYRSQAIENSLEGNLNSTVNNELLKYSEAIGFGFSFSRAKEGKAYWIDFQIKLNNGQIKFDK